MTESRSRGSGEAIHNPQASYWPIVLAAVVSVTVAGLLIHVAVSIVGLVLSVAVLVAWGVQRFPGPAVATRTSAEHPRFPALSNGEAEVEAPIEVSKPHGWWGMVWFIATEAIFFANLIAGYLYLRISSASWPPTGTPHADLLFPSVNTAILLLSGVPAYLGLRAIKRGNVRGLKVGLALAALLGAIFLAGQAYEYATMPLTPQSNIFGAGFFTLTGFHGAHVLAGIVLLVVVSVLAMRGRYSAQRHFAAEFASTYWHFVDAVWIFLFTILYLVR